MERVNSLLALFLVVFVCSLASGEEKSVEVTTTDSNATVPVCKEEHAKKGAIWCKESFKQAYIANKETRMIHNPMNTACCLSYNLAECIEYSYILANCTVVDEEVTRFVEESQNEANKPAYLAKSFRCAEQSEVKCKYLMREYDKARVQIELINGTPSLHSPVTPVVVIATSALLLVLRRS